MIKHVDVVMKDFLNASFKLLFFMLFMSLYFVLTLLLENKKLLHADPTLGVPHKSNLRVAKSLVIIQKAQQRVSMMESFETKVFHPKS